MICAIKPINQMIRKIFITPAGYHPLGLHELPRSQLNPSLKLYNFSFFMENFHVLRAIKSLKVHVFFRSLSLANRIYASVNFICIKDKDGNVNGNSHVTRFVISLIASYFLQFHCAFEQSSDGKIRIFIVKNLKLPASS